MQDHIKNNILPQQQTCHLHNEISCGRTQDCLVNTRVNDNIRLTYNKLNEVIDFVGKKIIKKINKLDFSRAGISEISKVRVKEEIMNSLLTINQE